jgi:WD40 repeat protein/serine/threonine protein kinase
MPGPPEYIDALPSGDWDELERILKRFETALFSGQRPEIAAHVPAGTHLRLPILGELVHTELEFRLRRGEPARVEEYLTRFPELRDAGTLIVDLLAAEFKCRRLQEADLTADEFCRRFPSYRERLVTVLDGAAPPESPNGGLSATVVGRAPASMTDTPPPGGAAGRSSPDGAALSVPGYEILGVQGRGGMGVVYKARQLALNRVVALKMILGGQHASPEDLARFHQEAQAVARLQHPNIVQIYEVGEVGGCPFCSLEFVDGGTLAQKLAGTPLPLRDAARIAEVLAGAIHAAHLHGIIHRDLKPANILLGRQPGIVGRNSKETHRRRDDPTQTGKQEVAHAPDASQETITDVALRMHEVLPKVTDFGLAKQLDNPGGQTMTGTIMGTPSYMAPEQAEGKTRRIGPAADVYSLGAILYEMLTGRPPFRAPTPVETIVQVISEEPVPPSRLRAVPRDLETICLKCLAKDASKRYPSAEELAGDLGRFLKGQPIHARRPHLLTRGLYWARRRPVVASLTLALVVAVVGGMVGMTALWLHAEAQRGLTQKAKDEADQARGAAEDRLARMQVARGVQLLDEGDWFGSLAWFIRPLDEHVAGPQRANVHRVRLASVLRQSPRLVQFWGHQGPVYVAIFSPDGTRALTAGEDRTARLWVVATGKPVCQPLQHTGAIVHAAFRADGSRLVTSSWDHTARVWDAGTGQLLHTLPHDSEVQHAVFSADGLLVVTASLDHTACLWDASTGKRLHALQHDDAVNTAAFDSGDKYVVTAGRDHTARIWEVATGKAAHVLRHADQVATAAYAPDGLRVLTACWDQSAQLWDASSGGRAGPSLKHKKEVLRAAFSNDGRKIITASSDGTAKLWDAATGQAEAAPLVHGDAVLDAAFSPDGNQVVTTSADGTTRLWLAATGQPLGPPLRQASASECAAVSRDGKYVLTGGRDHGVRLWGMAGASQGSVVFRHSGAVWHAAFSPDDQRLVTVGSDAVARVWDLVTGRELVAFRKHDEAVVHAAFSADGKRVVTASQDGTVRVWEAASGKELLPGLEHNEVRHAAFSPDDRYLVTAGSDGRAQVWEAGTGVPLATLHGHREAVVKASFSADGRSIVTAGWDGTARVWETATGRQVNGPLQHQGYVLDAGFFPGDARRVVTAGADGTAQVWEVVTGKPVLPSPLRHAGSVAQASFSPDGSRIVTASADGTARVWDARSGLPITPPLKHRGAVRRASFSPDGLMVATASADGTARVWDAATGLPVTPVLLYRGPVVHIAFSHAGTYLVATSTDGTARVWDLRPEDRPVAELLRQTDLLVGHRLDRADGMVAIEPAALQEAWQAMCPKR